MFLALRIYDIFILYYIVYRIIKIRLLNNIILKD